MWQRFSWRLGPLLALWLVVLTAPAAAFETSVYRQTPVVAGQALVTLTPQAPRTAIVRELSAGGFRVTRASTYEGVALAPEKWLQLAPKSVSERFLVVNFDPARSLDEAFAALTAMPGIATVGPNQIFYPAFVPNDPFYQSHQKYLRQLMLEKAWDRSRGGKVVVAVIDTGFLQSGLTDPPQYVLDGYDFADNDDNVDDYIGHGTQVANVIAHATDNGIGAAGVAPNAKILPCKVFRDGEDGAMESDILTAVDWAVQQGAQVINMSLGGGSYDHYSASTMRDAFDADVVVVAASGNESEGRVSYPAAYDGVIAVGSCNTHSQGEYPTRSGFSNFGDDLDFVAPGDAIIGESDYGNGIGFYVTSGTSLASPMVAGAAALLIDVFGDDYSAGDIQKVLQQTANRQSSGWSAEVGWGEINVQAAIEAISGPIPNDPPTAYIVTDTTSGSAPLTVNFTGGASDADGSISSYQWSFSSGEIYHSLQFSHTFAKPGVYTVYLTVSDDSGETASDNVQVEVGKESADETEDDGRGCGVGGRTGMADLLLLSATLTIWFLVRARRRRLAVKRADLF